MPLMTNDNIRLYPHDRVVGFVFGFIPRWIEPNHLTVLRFVLIPVILILLWIQSWVWAIAVFAFAALTDVVDGSLARTRAQITLWGTIADPTADKLLIGSLATYLVWRGLDPLFCIALIVLEVLIVANAFRRQQAGAYASANNYGKTKMFFQVLGVGALLVQLVTPLAWLTPFAAIAFCISLVFAFLSLVTYGL
ncbi:MAG: CDP-alcohol phosphatidyltransferase family protein [Patescibacteria group bacterium]